MSYKIKNGVVWVMHEGKWWLDSVLYTIYPDFKQQGLIKT